MSRIHIFKTILAPGDLKMKFGSTLIQISPRKKFTKIPMQQATEFLQAIILRLRH